MCENCKERRFGTPRDVIHFGPYTWRVLEERDGKVLLLCEEIVERRAYHGKFKPVTWETCTLRAYLNRGFLDKFSPEECARIALTRNENPDNTWGIINGERFDVPGGNPTNDHIFLLSVPEILKYFPGLKLHKDSDGDKWWYEAEERLAVKFNNNRSWWWLRSPGNLQYYAALVSGDGGVDLGGSGVMYGTGGVRPALWLNLEL